MKFFWLIYTFLSVGSFADGFPSEIEAMQKACKRDVATACYELGILYEKGLTGEKNITKSNLFFTKACDINFDKACKKLDYLKERN